MIKWEFKISFTGSSDTDVRNVNPGNVSLKHVYRRHEKWEGIIMREITGSIEIFDTDFDLCLESFDGGFYPILYIFLDGVQWHNVYVTDFADIDFNQKRMTLKSFNENLGTSANNFIYYDTKTFLISGVGISGITIQRGLSVFTDAAYQLVSVIEGAFTRIGVKETFDNTDCWYSTEAIDLDQLYIAHMADVYTSAGGSILGGSRRTTTLERIFKFIENAFNVRVYIENDEVKFKKPTELVLNTIDLSTQLEHLKQVSYRTELFYGREYFNMSDNNSLSTQADFFEVYLEYERPGNMFSIDLQEFTTWPEFSADLNGDGFFVAYLLGTTIEQFTGFYSGASVNNGRISPANLFGNFYNDYIYTKKRDYAVNDQAGTTTPLVYKPFIQLPEIKTLLVDPSEFFDGVIVEKNLIGERIGITYEQETDLNTNITTFRCYEFKNTLEGS